MKVAIRVVALLFVSLPIAAAAEIPPGEARDIGTLADKDYMAQVPDEYIYLIIKKGGAFMGKIATMPAWEKRLSDEEIRALVKHIRTFTQ